MQSTKKATRRSRKPTRKVAAKLPEFATIDDVAGFVDDHDVADCLEQLEDATQEFSIPSELEAHLAQRAKQRLEKRLLTLRLENRQIEDARRIAARKGMGYLTLMRVWIQEGIERNKSKKAS